MKFDYLLLDYDGTICHSEPAIIRSLEQTFREFGLALPDAGQSRQLMASGQGIGDIISVLHPDKSLVNDALVNEIVLKYRSIYDTTGDAHTLLFEGMKDVVEKLYDANIPLIVVSNKGINAVERSLRLLGIKPYTKQVIAEGAEIVGSMRMKPDPGIFEQLILPVYGANGLMIGDTLTDIRFAKNSGIPACWAAYGYGMEKECLAARPRYVIRHPSEILAIVNANL